jgi:hypothetical protein
MCRDPYLIMLSVCGCFTALSPLLTTGSLAPRPLLLQALATCHQTMQLVPPTAWHPAAARTYARIVYELVGTADGTYAWQPMPQFLPCPLRSSASPSHSCLWCVGPSVPVT